LFLLLLFENQFTYLIDGIFFRFLREGGGCGEEKKEKRSKKKGDGGG